MVTIPTIDQISGTTVMNKMRSLIHNYIEFGTEVANSVNYMQEVIDNLPHDITDVYNKATIDAMIGAINDEFDNYYTKTSIDTNYYTKTEVNNLISTIGSFHAVIVDELPSYGDEGVIYLLEISESGTNRYEEYIWINWWELIGQLSNIDLADYYTKTQSDDKFATKSNVYTKSECDVLFPVKSDVYTKTESNNKFIEDELTLIKTGTNYNVWRIGKFVIISVGIVGPMTITDLPTSVGYFSNRIGGTNSANIGTIYINYGSTTATIARDAGANEGLIGSLIYLTN